jgi:ABC-type branched-subunit amino acid transport system ATPase component
LRVKAPLFPKRQELHTKGYSVTFQKTLIFSNTTLRTSYLAASRKFEKQMLWGVFGFKRKEQWLDEIA